MFLKTFFFTFFLVTTASSVSVAQLYNKSDVRFFIYDDTTTSLSVKEVSSSPFKPLKTNAVWHAVTKSAIWIRFKGTDTRQGEQFLELSCPNFAELTYYQPSVGEHLTEYKTGMYEDFDNRPVPIDRFAFLITPGTEWHYIRIRTSHAINTEFYIKTREKIIADAALRNVIYSVYMGLMFAMIVGVSFYIYLIRYFSYLYYVGYVLAVSSLTLFEKGFYFQQLWPHHPMINAYIYLLPCALSLFMLLFLRGIWIRHALVTVLFRINLWGLTLLPFMGTIYFSFNGQFTEAFTLTQFHSVASGLLTVAISIISYVKADQSLKLPLILINVGLCILCIGILIFLSTLNDLLPINGLTDNALIVASSLELCFLTSALIIRSDEIYRKQKMLLYQNNKF
jgi:two-component system NtrC family sensor kinase